MSLQTFFEASATCEADHEGGTLAMSRDFGIDQFIISLIRKTQQRNGYFWFGLHDQRQEGQWEWIDGTELGTGYSRWREGQPDNFLMTGKNLTGEDCAAYTTDGWYDRNCESLKTFICEVMPEDAEGKKEG
ncbi:CD209 antigen-like protein E [Branchiostoma floridae]|uniref:CD209 antigen-like protein E n=1 Tax=Branchiostoma floridae TaxID=7739 RepID=A0A9J7LQM9_BRAFL|nr:CD209 antigen-like protein E [Branchiostoma floridae]